MYKNLEINPTINYVDGKITSDSVDSIVTETQESITELDKVIGADLGTFISSVSPLLMNKSFDMIPHVSYGVLINGCTDVFTVSGTRYVLSLVPEDASAILFSSGIYSYSPTSSFVNANEYTVSGRTIIFAQEPASTTVSVSYSGYVPEDYGAKINSQTLYPNPVNLSLGRVSAPIVTELDPVEFIYSISVNNETFLAGVDEEFSVALPNTIPTFLSSYVSGTGAIETPLDYASLWVLSSGKYTKVELTQFKIISANSFIVKAKSALTTTNTFVVSLFSKSIPEVLNELYVAYRNHNHDGYGNTKKLEHSSIESDHTVDYHTQYLRKKGYSNTDKDNLLLGDLFISSTDTTTDNSNTLNRSNMIIFGDYAFGHVVYRESGANGYIRIDARAGSGLNILLEVPAEGSNGKNFIKANDGLLYNSVDISATKTSMNIYGGYKLYLKADDTVDAEEIEVRLLTVKQNSLINIGGVKITATATGATILTETGKALSVSGDVAFQSGTFEGATINEVIIPDGKRIIFSTTGDDLKATSEGPRFKNRVQLSEYATISVVAEDNTSPISVSNFMTIASDNSLYVLRKVVSGLIVNGAQYSFRETLPGHTRIDRIQDWPRQDMFVNRVTVSEVEVGESDFTKRLGLKFGSTAKIYTSSNDTVCSMDSLIFESKDDIVMLRFGDTSTDCDSKEFAGLRIGNLSVNGSISSSGDIDTEGDITSVNVTISGQLRASDSIYTEKSIVGAALKSNGALSVSGDSSLQNVNVAGTLSINSLEVSGNGTITGDVSIGKSVSVSGSISISRDATIEGGLGVSGNIESARISSETGKFANIAVSGDVNISGTLTSSVGDFKSGLSVGGSFIAGSGTFKQAIQSVKITTNDLSTSKLYVEGKSSLKDTDISGILSVSDSLSVTGKCNISGGLLVDSGAKILGGLIVSEGISVYGHINASGDIEVSGYASITGTLTSGSAEINGNVVLSGSLLVQNGLASIKNLEVLSRAEFNTIGVNKIYLEESIIGSEETSASIGTITTGNLVVAQRGNNTTDKILSYVDIEAMRNVTVANELIGNVVRAKSVFTLGDQSSNSAVYLTTDGLHFSKGDSVLGVSRITTDTLIGRQGISWPELAQFGSQAAIGIIYAIEKSKFTQADNLSVEGILNIPRTIVSSGTLYFNKMVPLDPSAGYVDIVAGAAVYE